jgi:hypothetical protein
MNLRYLIASTKYSISEDHLGALMALVGGVLFFEKPPKCRFYRLLEIGLEEVRTMLSDTMTKDKLVSEFPNQMSAEELYGMIAGLGVRCDGTRLKFSKSPPEDLKPVIKTLKTGLRAILEGRRWFATIESRSNRGVNVRVVELETNEPLPADVVLLCVEGDGEWERTASCG